MLRHNIIVPLQLMKKRFQNGNAFLIVVLIVTRINGPYLEPSEQLYRFFPLSIHKIKFHILQNIYKCLIHGLISIKYNKTCELCDNILDKLNRGTIMVNKYFILYEEVIDVFHEKITFPK